MPLKEIKKIRRDNLNELIHNYGSTSEINEKLGRKRNHPSLTQIRNSSPRGNGTFYEMGDKLARLLEDKLSLPKGWMDTDHADVSIPDIDGDKLDGVWVPELENYGTMGNEVSFYEQDVIVGGLTLSHAFVRRLNVSHPSNLRVINAHGDSMQPTIYPGDKILVDEGMKDLHDGIYVLQSYDSVFIKRLSRNLRGQTLITSDNPNVKLSEELDDSESLNIIGRVVYVWHGNFV